jgi:hypothetical protein
MGFCQNCFSEKILYLHGDDNPMDYGILSAHRKMMVFASFLETDEFADQLGSLSEWGLMYCIEALKIQMSHSLLVSIKYVYYI